MSPEQVREFQRAESRLVVGVHQLLAEGRTPDEVRQQAASCGVRPNTTAAYVVESALKMWDAGVS